MSEMRPAAEPKVLGRIAAARLVNAARSAMAGGNGDTETPRRRNDPEHEDYTRRRKLQIQGSERLERVLEALVHKISRGGNGDGNGGGGKALSIGMIITLAGGFLTFITISQLVVKPIDNTQQDHARRLTILEANMMTREDRARAMNSFEATDERMLRLFDALAERVRSLEVAGSEISRATASQVTVNVAAIREVNDHLRVTDDKVNDLLSNYNSMAQRLRAIENRGRAPADPFSNDGSR